jgi:hypothetical protein
MEMIRHDYISSYCHVVVLVCPQTESAKSFVDLDSGKHRPKLRRIERHKVKRAQFGKAQLQPRRTTEVRIFLGIFDHR